MMNVKKINKAISIIMLIFVLGMSICSVVSAATGAVDPSTIDPQNADTTKIENIGGQIITIISVVGSVASIIVLIVLGLKYMMGSAEEKAEYKKTLMPYVIGAILVFAASAIAGMVYQFSSSIAG